METFITFIGEKDIDTQAAVLVIWSESQDFKMVIIAAKEKDARVREWKNCTQGVVLFSGVDVTFLSTWDGPSLS
jgi:hypothetical protein